MARTKTFNEEEALTRAMELFWKKGYHGTSMQDLVDAMGISRSSMYDTFGDKHEIFLQAFQHYKQSQQSVLASLSSEGDSISKVLGTFFNHLLRDCVTDEEKRGCLVVNSSTELAWEDEAVRLLIEENYEEFERLFLPMFTLAIKKGEVDIQKNPRAMVRFLYVNMVGLRAVSRYNQDPEFLRDSAKMALTTLLK
jgi:TetR/AcrR family transcriptional repressor of nem operon